MKKSGIYSFLSFLPASCFSFLLISCAQVVSPTGGEKDITPPKMVKSIPENHSIHFTGKKITLNFNEFIKLKDLSNQLIISPPLKKAPETKFKNKTITLEFDDTLKPNTTYTFSFGNSIADFTEENPLENFQYVISTGDYLDSLTLSGKVDKALNHSPVKGTLVMLYSLEKTVSDSFPYHELPDYFGKSNEQGDFKISNIREGKYKLIGLKEGNSNYLFDSDDEQIGFSDSVITLTHPLQLDVSLFQELKSKLYLKKPVKLYDGQLICAFSKPAGNISFEALKSNQKFSWSATEISSNKDTARFWFAGTSVDSLLLKVLTNGKVLDTVMVALPKVTEEVSGRDKKKLVISTNLNPNGTFDLNKKISLLLSHPVKRIISSKMLLTNRKDTIPIQFNPVDSLKKKYEISAKLIEDSTYRLLIPAGTFEDFNGLKNDTLQSNFQMLMQRDYGTLKLAVKLVENNDSYILQMLDEKDIVLNERFLNKSEIVYYEYVKPQNYKFKLIVDSNKNEKWDTGKFVEKRQAERTINYPQTLTVRANWDLEEKWDLTK